MSNFGRFGVPLRACVLRCMCCNVLLGSVHVCVWYASVCGALSVQYIYCQSMCVVCVVQCVCVCVCICVCVCVFVCVCFVCVCAVCVCVCVCVLVLYTMLCV